MATLRETFRSMLRPILRPTNMPAALALLVIVVAGLFAEYQNRRVNEQSLRADVLGRVSLIRAKLEGNINSNIQLVRGLVATLSTEPRMEQERFAELAANLLAEKSQLRNIAAAPDLVVIADVPAEGQRAGDRPRLPQERGAARGGLAGPRHGRTDPRRAGRSGAGRARLHRPASRCSSTMAMAARHFWGIVSAVVDVDRLYRDSGLLDPELPIEIAITGHDAKGVSGARFFGARRSAQDNPVIADVILPSGSWQIAAVPKGGWHARPPTPGCCGC